MAYGPAKAPNHDTGLLKVFLLAISSAERYELPGRTVAPSRDFVANWHLEEASREM